ncbi:hypothetical protein [Phascolarctobacterium sp.]|uniref:hypothetical protein n=1 Tax=Phascolarctobacterium sp. TaxID=2049039 RepID=UPI00386EDE72
MAKKKKQEGAPFTAGNLIEYLQGFPKDAQLLMTPVARRGKEIFGYPVEKFTLITDCPQPHILVELGKAQQLERPAQRIERQMKERGKK